MPRAGELRHRITIQQNASTTRDATGGITAVWTTVCVMYVALTAMEARENDAMRQRYAEATYAMKGRYKSGITPKMRVVEGTVASNGTPASSARVFDILGAIDPDGRRTDLHLAVKERDLG